MYKTALLEMVKTFTDQKQIKFSSTGEMDEVFKRLRTNIFNFLTYTEIHVAFSLVHKLIVI